MSIKVENITKLYGEQKALNNINFAVENGEIVGFLGPNGAGKSTLMKILTTYIQPSSGQCFVNGIDVLKNPKDVQKIIGYLPEHNPLYLDLYVREYLEFCIKIHQVHQSRIDEVIELTGLTTEAHKKIGALSKGYRQRVGLAATLLHEPQVLILDEPTTGLDPNQLVEIRQLIKNVGKDKTVFLSTHIMQEVEAICDRIIIINQGELVTDNKLGDLMKQQDNKVIEVEFKETVAMQYLQEIEGVIEVLQKFENTYHIVFDTFNDPRAILFDFAKANNVTILQMQQVSKNLEMLFREKTQK